MRAALCRIISAPNAAYRRPDPLTQEQRTLPVVLVEEVAVFQG
jgi:hypothetical protein